MQVLNADLLKMCNLIKIIANRSQCLSVSKFLKHGHSFYPMWAKLGTCPPYTLRTVMWAVASLRTKGAHGQISNLSFPSPFPTLSPSLPFLCIPIPNHFLPLPLITARGLWERYSSPSRSRHSPAAKRIFVRFTYENLQIC